LFGNRLEIIIRVPEPTTHCANLQAL